MDGVGRGGGGGKGAGDDERVDASDVWRNLFLWIFLGWTESAKMNKKIRWM